MGRVKDWLMDMEEDARVLTREDWIEKHGENQIDTYNEVHQELYLIRRQDHDGD